MISIFIVICSLSKFSILSFISLKIVNTIILKSISDISNIRGFCRLLLMPVVSASAGSCCLLSLCLDIFNCVFQLSLQTLGRNNLCPRILLSSRKDLLLIITLARYLGEIAFQNYLNIIFRFNIIWGWAAVPVEDYFGFTLWWILDSQVLPFSEGCSSSLFSFVRACAPNLRFPSAWRLSKVELSLSFSYPFWNNT